jgi:hypothetical protein
MSAELLTVTAYARHRRERGLPGGALNAVQTAIKSRRISLIERDGKVLIDPAVADDEWERNTDHAKVRGARAGSAHTSGDDDPGSFMAWKTLREKHEAEMAAMRAQQMRSELVRTDDVRRHLVGSLRTLRAAVDALPDRLAPLLAAEADALKIRALLKVELDEVLAEVVRTGFGLARIGGGA